MAKHTDAIYTRADLERYWERLIRSLAKAKES